ncbi:MAG: alpha/beta hydrolase [Oscillospiraceae bacterium]|jgi:acetyl esterase/lipase|nr:alpha/beta hydrolase [Oscillospiraceae bacterium]
MPRLHSSLVFSALAGTDANGKPRYVTVKFYPCEERGRPFAFVLPGGAYAYVEWGPEGKAVADALNAMGYNVFVCGYRCGFSKQGFAALAAEDALIGLRFALSEAGQLGCDTAAYSIVGFSAGAHIALQMAAKGFDGSPPPALLMCAYPLVDCAHGGAVVKLCRLCAYGTEGYKTPDSPVQNVLMPLTEDCPPLYIWQGADDAMLPIEFNSIQLSRRAEELDIKYFFKQYPHVKHGAGIGTGSDAEGWLADACAVWEALR